MRSPTRSAAGTLGPVGLAVFPILNLWAANVREASLAELALPLGAAVVAGLTLVWLGRWLIAGAGGREALFAAAGVTFLWAWSPLARLGAELAGGPVLAGAVIGVLGVLLLGTLARFLRDRPALDGAALGIGAVGLVAVALPLAQLVRAVATEPPAPATTTAEPTTEGATPDIRGASPDIRGATPDIRGASPDIYWIVLDAYGRSDVLREHYGIETGLAEALAAQGFHVAAESGANYTTTLHAIPSALNLDYIENLVTDAERRSRNVGPLFRLTQENRLVRTLRSRGYSWVAYSSGYRSTEVAGSADVFIEAPQAMTEFESVLLERSPAGWLTGFMPERSAYTAHRSRILHALETLPDIADDPRPTFTFMHLISPHHPFVFGEHGEDVSPKDRPFRFNDGGVGGRKAARGEVHAEYLRGYRDQALYVGGLVAHAVAEIQARSPEPPVIVVQGDHGPNSHWPHTVPWERVPILNALLVPGVGADQIEPTLSPVNNFRLVLREVLGEDLPPLPDEHYLSTYTAPWTFRKVPLPPLRTAKSDSAERGEDVGHDERQAQQR